MILEIVKKLENKSIAILGFGREGKSSYNFLKKYVSNANITILDKNKIDGEYDCNIITGDSYLDNLDKYDLILKTPGISLKDLDIESIKDKITSQVELFLEVNRDNVIGITGTKGKSTTSTLLYQVIKEQNSNTILAGNIGVPIFDCLDASNDALWVLELSSHQLEFLRVSPHIGIVLNLFPEHLDHAGSIEHYYNCKMNIFKYQNNNDILIYCKDNENLNNLILNNKFLGKHYSVSLKDLASIYKKDNLVYYNNKVIYDTKEEILLKGEHNIENIMVVLLVSELLNLDREKVIKVIKEFKPLPYRMEYIGEFLGVFYYVDTLATIPEATEKSLEALGNVNTLIIGGMDRGISYDEFIDYLKKSNVSHFICMPKTGHDIGKFLPKEKVYLVKDLEEACHVAKKVTEVGTKCLLSPAASSYDVYKNYQEKGDKFKEYILG